MINFNRMIENEEYLYEAISDEEDYYDDLESKQTRDLEMTLDLKAMRLIRQHDYMHLF